MVVRTLADLRREDEQRKADAETGETAPLLRADTQSMGGSSAASGGSSGYAQRSTALRVLELLFPFFRWRSLLLLVSIVDWAVYITTLALDSEMPLVPSPAILVTFGANVPSLVAKGELRMGFAIERRYGYLKFVALYAAAAVYGNLLSAAAIFCGSIKVGASTAGKRLFLTVPAFPCLCVSEIEDLVAFYSKREELLASYMRGFGMMGVEMAELALSWRRLQHRDRQVFLWTHTCL
ncbi:hypothetical protein Esti_000402 [Eimeria stiedai]